MSPAEAGAATVTVICVAVIAAYRTLCWLLDRHVRKLRARRTQLERDLARYKAWRHTAAVEQQPGDPYSDDRINAELCFIPHQTRRTEEDQ
jgi:hypothetical protein